MTEQDYDIIVAGAGLIGSTIAIPLARSGMRVAIVDRINPAETLDAAYDGRTLALSWGTRLILEKYGLWNENVKDATPINQIRVSSTRPGSYVDYGNDLSETHPMGYMLEIRHLRAQLISTLQSLGNCTIIAPSPLQDIQQDDKYIRVILEDGLELRSPLLIGADGRASRVREVLGIKPWILPYNQSALVFMTRHELPHHGTAFEHFMPHGPLAFLPMSENRSSVVWTLPTDAAPLFMKMDKTVFNEELQHAFGNALGKIEIDGKCWSYPLEAVYCRQWFRGRSVLVGDACHGMHPVAGQGFNVGLRDVDTLVQKLIRAWHSRQDIGDTALLKSYQRSRRLDSLSMVGITDGIVRAFSTHKELPSFLTGTGLKITNRIPILKRMMTRHAMGLSLWPHR